MNETILELLKFCLPAIILSGTLLYIFQEYMTQKKEEIGLQTNTENNIENNSTRLQAYERMVLYLERINPTTLINNLREPDMSVKELQFAMLQQIRAEYDHNVSTQIYIHNESWNAILQTKENVTTIINKAAQHLDPNANGIELAKKIIEVLDLLDVSNPCDGALITLRSEAKMFMQ